MESHSRKRDEAGMACQNQQVTRLHTISDILPVLALIQAPCPGPLYMWNYIHTSTLSGLKV